MFKKIILMALTTFFTVAYAKEINTYSGKVYKTSDKKLYLEDFQISFQCEEEICKLAKQLKKGDDIIATFDSKNGKNKLLSIRKCQLQDLECTKVVAKRQKEFETIIAYDEEKLEKHLQACFDKMEKELSQDERYIPEKEIVNAKIVEEFNTLGENSEEKKCRVNIVKKHEDAALESCLKNKCGDGISGGCYHFFSGVHQTYVLENAVEKCR